MASCYRSVQLFNEAEQSYNAVTVKDPKNVEARVQLAGLFEGLGRTEEALQYVNEAIELRREAAHQRQLDDELEDGDEHAEDDSFIPTSAVARARAKKRKRTNEPKPEDRRLGPGKARFREPKDIRLLHVKLQGLQNRVKMGRERNACGMDRYCQGFAYRV